MSRRIFVIGIGTGGLDQLTLAATRAIKQVDVFLVPDKGDAKAELLDLRRAILDQFGAESAELVAVPDPKRGPDAERNAAEYATGVRDWHAARVAAFAKIIDGYDEGVIFGFLVWGDPMLYDSTLRITDALSERIDCEVTVIPGITAIQALCASHEIPLNQIGASVLVTTGRRLLDEYRNYTSDLVVLLDGHLQVQHLIATDPDLMIYWGAYLGSDHEVTRSGRISEVVPELLELRARLRSEHGWVMDTYLLRRSR